MICAQMETYYQRNREYLLNLRKEYLANPVNKERYIAYQRKYYQEHRIPPAPKIPLPPAPKKPDGRGKSKHKRVGRKGARPPKPYYETSKLDDIPNTYAQKKLEANTPLGLYTRPEGENPFLITFN